MPLNIQLLPKQLLFMQSKTRGTIFRGGLGSGKTRILCYKAIANAMLGRRECIVSYSYTMLRDVVLYTLVTSLALHGLTPGRGYILNRTDMKVTIGKGEILMRSADNPDALRGLNLDDFLMDEARMLRTGELFEILIGRIRNTEDSQWYICSTPHGKDWAWRLSQDKNVTMIVQRTEENTFLPKSWIADVRAKYTSKYASQELDAEILEFEGEIIKSKWFRQVPYVKPAAGVRFWDIAVAIKRKSDYSAGALCLFSGDAFCLADMRHGRWRYPDLRKIIVETAKLDGPQVIIGIEQAGQQQAIIDDIRTHRELSPYVIKAVKPRGDKKVRCQPWASQAELGNMMVMDGPWKQNFFDECDSFTGEQSEHDDSIDAVSGAYTILTHTGTAQFANLPI